MSEPVFRVLKPGLLSTLQDLGRHGYQRLGVSPGGAMDAFALRLANRLVGNPIIASVWRLTLAGTELEVLRDCEVALAGADLGAHLDSKPLALLGKFLCKNWATSCLQPKETWCAGLSQRCRRLCRRERVGKRIDRFAKRLGWTTG